MKVPRLPLTETSRGAGLLLVGIVLVGLSGCSLGPLKPTVVRDLLSPAIPVTRVVQSTLPGAGAGKPAFDSVDFISREVGFASAHLGQTADPILWHTTDGGKTWSTFTPKVPGYGALLLKLDFTSSRDGYAIVGSSCSLASDQPMFCEGISLARTENGGHTFTTVVGPQYTSPSDPLRAATLTDDADVELAGSASGIAVMPDGFYVESGGSWKKTSVTGTPIAAAWGKGSGIVVTETSCGNTPWQDGCAEDVLHTTDGGATFTKVQSFTASPELARVGMDGNLAVLDWVSKPGVATCEVGCEPPATLTVDVSTDGGAIWTTSTTQNSTADTRIGIPVVNAAVGMAWIPKRNFDPYVSPFPDGILDGSGLFGPDPAWGDVQPQWDVSQLSPDAPGSLWAIGADAAGSFLASTIDTGSTWQLAPFEVTPQESVDFVTPRIGYGVGAPGMASALLRTVNGGKTWTIVRASGVASASFWSPQNGVLQLARGIDVTTDGGVNLSPLPALPAQLVGAPIQAAPGQLWIVQDFSTDNWWSSVDEGLHWRRLSPASGADFHVRTDDALAPDGALWSLKTDYTPVVALSLRDKAKATSRWHRVWKLSPFDVADDRVHALSSTDCWVYINPSSPNYFGPFFFRLIHTTDGGKTWTEIGFPEGPGLSVLSLDFVNDLDGWMLIPQAGLYRTTDGGRHWTRLS